MGHYIEAVGFECVAVVVAVFAVLAVAVDPIHLVAVELALVVGRLDLGPYRLAFALHH